LAGTISEPITVPPPLSRTAAAKYSVEMEGIVSTAESLNVPENHFDFVYIANTIHHVSDRSRLFEQIRRALKPGGSFFSYDPLAYNPLINLYRRMATEVRTPDERPLTRADLNLARRYFSNVAHREFWIATLAHFENEPLPPGLLCGFRGAGVPVTAISGMVRIEFDIVLSTP